MLIQSKRVWVAGQFIPAQLEIDCGKIRAIRPWGDRDPDTDYASLRILPGFIDLHTHGAYGFDTNDAQPEGLARWAAAAPREGITAFLPTTVTADANDLTAAVTNVRAVAESASAGAEIIGVHLEGPFLAKKFKGSQPERHIIAASIPLLEAWQEAAGGMVRLITVAPEADPGYDFIAHCVRQGIAVNIGHTDATYEQALMAIANGATGFTHTHNAMSRYSHKAPGALNAALRSKNVFCEIIPDGIHVSIPVIGSFFATRGIDSAIAVTDSLRVKGLPRGTYDFGGQEVETSPEGAAYLKGTDTLAGSTLFFNEGLKNMADRALVPLDTAINACTINPARHIGIDDRKGKLCAGYDADIVVLGEDYSVEATYCRGTIFNDSKRNAD